MDPGAPPLAVSFGGGGVEHQGSWGEAHCDLRSDIQTYRHAHTHTHTHTHRDEKKY